MNRLVIGVSVDADLQARLGEDFCNGDDLCARAGNEFGLSAIEETKFPEADDKALGRNLQVHLMIGELFAHGGLELLFELDHVSGRAGCCRVVRVFIVIDARGICVLVRGEAGIGATAAALVGPEGAEGLKAVVDGPGELSDCLVVAIGRGKQDDEKGKEQGDEVRVGEQPPIVVD